MRAVITLLATLLACAPLCAQAPPAAAAPLAQHVTHLVEQARGGFAELLGAPTYRSGSIYTATFASAYQLRFRGVLAAGEIRRNHDWNVLHAFRLPLSDSAAVLRQWQRGFSEIDAALPPNWRRSPPASPGLPPYAYWSECQNGGRQVALNVQAGYEQAPALHLVVYRYDAPCRD